jgi:secondary thiamine-phosphate synthase enzyme
MKVHQEIVHASTHGQGFVNVTHEIERVVEAAKIRVGVVSVFVQHTSASLVVQENADPAVLRDLQRWIARIAPEDAKAYEHDQEGDDDMPAHIRSAITKTNETIPVRDGSLALGTWQAIYVWEHRARSHRRSLVVTVMGD